MRGRGVVSRGVVSRGVVSVVTAVMVGSALAGAAAVAADDGSFRLLTKPTESGPVVIRWNPCQDAITYKVNTTHARETRRGVAAARARARKEVVSAMDKVSAASGLPLTYTGTTRQIPTGDDWWQKQDQESEIVVAFVSRAAGHSTLLSGGSWGEGGQVYKYDGATVVTGRGFAVFDRDKARRLAAGFGPGTTRGNLILHELGHVMGLDHVRDARQLMNPAITSRSPNGFAAGDRAGLAELGPEAGCIDNATEFWPGS